MSARAPLLFSEDYTGTRHVYGYTNRPFGIAHQPDGYLIGSYRETERPSPKVRWGTIEYPAPLPVALVRNFELVALGARAADGTLARNMTTPEKGLYYRETPEGVWQFWNGEAWEPSSRQDRARIDGPSAAGQGNVVVVYDPSEPVQAPV